MKYILLYYLNRYSYFYKYNFMSIYQIFYLNYKLSMFRSLALLLILHIYKFLFYHYILNFAHMANISLWLLHTRICISMIWLSFYFCCYPLNFEKLRLNLNRKNLMDQYKHH